MELTTVDQPQGTDEVLDVLVVGAGIVGVYQLYRLLEAGFAAKLVEAGGGVGGTWFWNRYPGARFDSESYTYAYLFSKELFEEWQWQEHFAPQPETERYLNYVIDRFDLRRHMRFDAAVFSAVYDEASGTYLVRTNDGTATRTRYLIAATGVLSVPYFPNVVGREDFKGESHHTGRWPADPIDFKGKRVAVVGTGASGVQVIPVIADDVASLTAYQRTANWCTPLNNSPITDAEQAALQAGFESMRDTLNASVGGFLHVPSGRETFHDPEEERLAFYEQMWQSPGFAKLSSHYSDIFTSREANLAWCQFIAGKIRNIVKDPDTASKLIPTDHVFAEKRPPFVTGYYEVFNNANVSIVDLKTSPMVRVTETGIETTEGHREFDIIVWATGFDFGTGALNRMGVRGRNGLGLEQYWAEGPITYLGLQCRQFPNLFFPGGPHGSMGNNPRYAGDQVDFVMDTLIYAREHGFDVIEIGQVAQDRWTRMIETYASYIPFGESSYFFGTNIEGKPRRLLLNPAGRPKMIEIMKKVVADNYDVYDLSRSST